MTSQKQGTGFVDAHAANAGQIPVVRSIFDFSAEALGELKTWLEQNPPSLAITSILGFTQFTATHAEVGTRETTTSATYADLATVGPTLTGVGPGTYVILYGAGSFNSAAANACWISVSLNGAAATDGDGSRVDSLATTGEQSQVRGLVKTLSLASNSVTVKYKTGGGTASFENRWLIAIKAANA